MGMIKRRLSDGQAMTERGAGLGAQIESSTILGRPSSQYKMMSDASTMS
jgi:hypothetical protein